MLAMYIIYCYIIVKQYKQCIYLFLYHSYTEQHFFFVHLFGMYIVRFLLKDTLQDTSIDKTKRQQLEHIETLINKEAESLNLDMVERKALTAKRNKIINARCFHKIGLSVPFDKSTEVGYRSLTVTDGE